jgi:membrane protease YdiL (CAAX protease family)
MKKFNFRNIKIKKVKLEDISDQTLFLNLYITQGITLLLGIVIILFQRQPLFQIFKMTNWVEVITWGVGLAALIILANWVVAKLVPEDILDDGGINERLFGSRNVLQIALLSFVVALCEEILFRGAIQYKLGPYWTSIVFAAIHIRYLKHWIMTGFVFGSSYALGWIYVQTGTLWAPIIAHFLIDFILGCMIRYRKEV